MIYRIGLGMQVSIRIARPLDAKCLTGNKLQIIQC